MLLTSNVQIVLIAIGVNKTHAYLFDEGLGLHGEHSPYTFYNYEPTPDAVGIGSVNATVAKAFQDWLVNFVSTGTSNEKGSVGLSVYGDNQTVGLLSSRALRILVKDPKGKERCGFWEKALYF